jgi:cell division septum initiation protein DivIVA
VAKPDEDAPGETGRDAAVQEGQSPIRTVWERSEGAHADHLEIPEFEIVRKGYSQDQVKDFANQLGLKVRNLERQLDEQREGAERLRMIEEEFGNPGSLLERLDQAERELEDTRDALDAARSEAEVARTANESEAGRTAALEREVADLRVQLEARSRQVQSGGPDAYGAIATQVAELLRSAGVQAEQIRKEAAEEAERLLDEAHRDAAVVRNEAEADADGLRRDARAAAERIAGERDEVLREARTEADAIKRDAESYAEALRRDAQQEAERITVERDGVIQEANAEAERIQAEAEAEAKRLRGEAETVVLRARTDAERMLTAALSRRDLVRSEMLAMRERLGGALALLEPVLEGTSPAPAAPPEAPAAGGSGPEGNGEADASLAEDLALLQDAENEPDDEDDADLEDADAVEAEPAGS